jgi:2-hydroxy-6-oxonona-2,4-dienedioate hydrolase
VVTEALEDPAVSISRIESLSTRQTTACGAGSMVWRSWGGGRPLVLLHGASGSWTHWIRNILPLAAWFRVLAPDMPGFGDSETPPEPHTADGLADMVAAGIDAVVPSPAELDIAAFSFGGIIGGLVAARLGSRVRTLALLGAGGFGLPRAPTRPLVRIPQGLAPDAVRHAHRENLAILMIACPEKIDDLAVLAQMENLRRTRFKSGAIPESDALLRALRAIRARITGIWGGRDAFVGGDVEARRRILASVQPDLDFRVIDDAGHWAIYEAATEVDAALLDMLGVAGARPA